ncbi:hypothetical protein NQ317_001075 [Molorchus minor]|uniref:Uncharacterized protein n=1 Tax=Molorchus minor TaxID=1323400 RepID=A0ABQ9JN56_9CUCU|nr:hypothetical protein NQ317_001075 [Molorchus minor]
MIHPSGIDPLYGFLQHYTSMQQVFMAQNTAALITGHLTEEWIQFPQNFITKLRVKEQFLENCYASICKNVMILKIIGVG